jgi:hypothetical protein
MTIGPAGALRRLTARAYDYGAGLAAERLALLRRLDRARLGSAAAVRELHERLCFLHAYPDSPAVFAQVSRMLATFGRRPDLGRHRKALVDSGIRGTDIYYRFGAPTARWLARRWGAQLSVDWDEVDEEKVARHLTLLALDAESPGQDEPPLEGRAWLDRLRGRGTDAAFLVSRLAKLDASPAVRDHFHDELGLMLRLEPGRDTPTRSGARDSRARLTLKHGPLRRDRPDLRAEALRPPRSIRPVGPRDGDRLVDLAREAMVTRSRDLDAFAGASPRDVRIADCGDGLEFVCLGVAPPARLLLEAVYGYLVLQNGVPIGYALASALFGSSEIAFNVFETFRGAEAAWAYGRFLGVVRAMFGTDTFTIFPYQLGHGNEEGIESGAWWFYYKLGYRPREAATLRLAGRELGRMRRRPAYRSGPATLRRLAQTNVFFELGPDRDDVIGVLPIDRVGLAVTDAVARRFGSDRDGAADVLSDEAAAILGAGDWRRFPADERLAWRRLAPLTTCLAGVTGWPRADRAALAAIMRAKGGRRESAFVSLADRHVRFRQALIRLATRR